VRRALAAYGWLILIALWDSVQASVCSAVLGVVLKGIGKGFVQPTINYGAPEHVEPREIERLRTSSTPASNLGMPLNLF